MNWTVNVKSNMIGDNATNSYKSQLTVTIATMYLEMKSARMYKNDVTLNNTVLLFSNDKYSFRIAFSMCLQHILSSVNQF